MNAVVKRETQIADTLQLDSIKNQVNGLLDSNPRKMEAFKTRMIKMSTSYMLKDCTPESLIAAGVQALTLDLPLEAGQGYVVKYGSEAQLDVGYKGWQVLAKRSGYSAMADNVYACDFFEQSGFGFDVKMDFQPNHSDRKTADDKWVQENIKGVIVSIREDETKLVQTRFVERDMLIKIVGMSPSMGSEKARKYSPHENWASQMFSAKALKQILSKMPIDLSSTMAEAIQIVNGTEAAAQNQPTKMPLYSDEKFEANFPKWKKLVEDRKKSAVTIITQFSNGYSLTEKQTEKLRELYDSEPIEGEVVEVVQEAS